MSNKFVKISKPPKPRKRATSRQKKTAWTLPTVLGLALGVLGAVGAVELRPQVLVSPQEPVKRSEPFTVPFRIDNTGYLSFNVVHVFCYIVEVKAGRIRMNANSAYYPEWNNVILDRGDSGTVMCNFYGGVPPVDSADMAIVIDYEPFRGFPLGRSRKFFRFKGIYVDNWQWTRTPASEIEPDADKQMDDQLRKIEEQKSKGEQTFPQ